MNPRQAPKPSWPSARRNGSGRPPGRIDLVARRLLLGATGLELKDEGEAVTGYVLAKDAWGKGYATEA